MLQRYYFSLKQTNISMFFSNHHLSGWNISREHICRLFHDGGRGGTCVFEFVALADFLAEVERVACRQLDELMGIGGIGFRRLVEPLAVEPRCLFEPRAAEDVDGRGTDVPFAVAPAGREVVIVLAARLRGVQVVE